MVDVVIAGGGIAGSALAIQLGRQGRSVEIFERGQFPREKPCGEGLMPAGVAALRRLGLAEAVGGSAFCGVRFHFREHTVEGKFPAAGDIPTTGLGQRRSHLDRVLFFTAAETPGVSAHTGARVDQLLWENGRAAGLLVDGGPRRARLVVAADGLHSPIRRELGLDRRQRRKRFGVRAHFRLAPGQSQPPWVEIFARPGYELYLTPLPNHEVLVAALGDAEALPGPIETTFHGWRRAPRALAQRFEGAEQVTSLLGAAPLSGGARRGVAPGVVLLGDAAEFLDPITGGGMTQALLTAELLARHIPDRLETDDSWLLTFERERQALLRDYRLLTRIVLWLVRRPGFAERVIPSLRRAPALFSHVIGVSGGVRGLLGLAPQGAPAGAP